MKRIEEKLGECLSLGFDASCVNGKLIQVACSQCEALVINGFPIHERGCGNTMHDCAGCDTYIPVSQKYCEDCL